MGAWISQYLLHVILEQEKKKKRVKGGAWREEAVCRIKKSSPFMFPIEEKAMNQDGKTASHTLPMQSCRTHSHTLVHYLPHVLPPLLCAKLSFFKETT